MQVVSENNIVTTFFKTTLRYIDKPKLVGLTNLLISFSYIGSHGDCSSGELRPKASFLKIRERSTRLIYCQDKSMSPLPSDNILKSVVSHGS